MDTAVLEELLVKQNIRDHLTRYCRGLDRMDKHMAYGVFHPDATVNYHDIFEGSGHGFVDWVWEAHAEMACHSHQITNVLTQVSGDKATSEAYVTVVLWTPADDANKRLEIISRGRYLDNWAKRDTTWAIEHRVFVADMQSTYELEAGLESTHSRRDESDPSFGFIRPFK